MTPPLSHLAHTLFHDRAAARLLVNLHTEQLIDANATALDVTGFAQPVLLRIPLTYLLNGATELWQQLRRETRRAVPFEAARGFELRRAGEQDWLAVHVQVVPLQDDEPLALLTLHDPEQQQRLQRQLRTTESELRQLLASISDSIWSLHLDAEGRATAGYCSPVVERIVGQPGAAIAQGGVDGWLAICLKADRQSLESALLRLRRREVQQTEIEYRIVRPDGRVRWVRNAIRSRPLAGNGLLRLDGVLTDITERKREERLLDARRSVLEAIARGEPIADILNGLVRAIEEQLPGHAVSILLLDPDGERLRHAAAIHLPDAYLRAIDGVRIGPNVGSCGTAAFHKQTVVVSDIADDPLWANYRDLALSFGLQACWSTPILALNGGVLGTFAVYDHKPNTPSAHDLHLLDVACHLAAIALERERTEQAVRASEAKYRTLVENLGHCVFLKDVDFRFVAANELFCRVLGCSEAEVIGKTDYDFYPAALADKFRADDRRVLESGERLEVEEESLVEGQMRFVRAIKTPVRDSTGRITGVLGVFSDVSERRALEAQLRQAQKMEAIGQLAGGVAHDFNNLLTAILGNLSLIVASAGDDDNLRDLAESAERAALRAANLTGRLLDLARRPLLRSEALQVNAIIDEVLALLRRTIDPRIAVEVRRAADLWPVRADGTQINQVLMNLCLNARDAMPEGGKLTIQSDNVVIAPEEPARHVEAHPGEYIRLRVEDSGLGIERAVQARIFEPFFTTKDPGKGTGLGLAMVFRIVQQHHGWIECDSAPGCGTRFDVYLPRLHGVAVGEPESVPPVPETTQGDETILLVDDEAFLRHLGQTVLEQQGYKVLLAGDGMEALALFEQHHRAIDLVILDLTMPRLSGRDTLPRLVALDPQVRVLLSSGFAAEQVTPAEQEMVVGFVSKPYRPQELLQHVRHALDQPVVASFARRAALAVNG